MAKLLVEKSGPLVGTVKINGAKNSVLKLMAASLLAEEACVIESVPDLLDVEVMITLLESLGQVVNYDKTEETLEIRPSETLNCEAPYELLQKMRASFLVMGPLLAKKGIAKVSMPGGCAIGARPIDLHLKGFQALGAEVTLGHGYIEAKAENGLVGSEVYLDFPSVGATENIMMAATMAKGQTLIQNAAKEPEIIDLANFLNEMGANVKGAGTDTIRINGVTALKGSKHQTMPDRIITATYMVAAAMTNGDVTIENVVSSHVKPITAKLREMGVTVEDDDDRIRVMSTGGLKAVDITTLPYPGFPTDVQAPFMALLSISEGTSVITETVFENRFRHVAEINRMGANVKIEGHSAVIQGVKDIQGAQVKATDLRAGAALVLAGLIAEGVTEVDDIYHIDRGYPQIEKDLVSLGAKIRRIEENEK
ncbi:UDP-N-acetylglucosamine 1-carboxyvinyltransferase [Fusibacter ferrireducens]|uniref:UDP-N-acetylglucosamine 1-carboxyvinyltransferase n=1 Tax=Fusibacter ferrireducens TaxID=2785058 RepID=A0ABR9ZVQ5_9FIRM|nr:UDP-N-acetylglucosamine 1-carboxyvinyltransferase [Fusibacter ferrireducens]MBF4694532.1 UDP-N-acetylglucosamine 1-carboxyvinyltransferase [Fusibacter ferrireducens]